MRILWLSLIIAITLAGCKARDKSQVNAIDDKKSWHENQSHAALRELIGNNDITKKNREGLVRIVELELQDPHLFVYKDSIVLLANEIGQPSRTNLVYPNQVEFNRGDKVEVVLKDWAKGNVYVCHHCVQSNSSIKDFAIGPLRGLRQDFYDNAYHEKGEKRNFGILKLNDAKNQVQLFFLFRASTSTYIPISIKTSIGQFLGLTPIKLVIFELRKYLFT
jgi:hypothetical protein